MSAESASISDAGGSSDDFLDPGQRAKERKKALRKARQEQIGPAKHARVKRDWVPLRTWKRLEQSDEVIEEELQEACVQERGKIDVNGLIIRGRNFAGWRLLRVETGRFNNTTIAVYECCMSYRAGCPTQIKIIRSPDEVSLLVTQRHTEESHAQDKSKYLTVEQRSAVRKHLKANPLAPARQIAAAVGNASPQKEIDPSLRRCVSGFVRRQRANFNQSSIAGKLLDSTYASINAFCLTALLQGLLAV